ncbi:hypothetical protein [Variovorax rhizosphaerae]|uniref:Uncharacterized protein n=1 Tax=Variovorax rhizosphaerae TaxID=1836200 RepID=A0ABU8WJZ0_9BURK
MKEILLCVLNPDAAQIQLAIELIDAWAFPTGESQPATVLVLADAEVCAQAGLVGLGRGKARTIENGERRTTPVVAFPMASEHTDDDLEVLRRMGAIEDSNWSSVSDSVARIIRERKIDQMVAIAGSEHELTNLRASAENSKIKFVTVPPDDELKGTEELLAELDKQDAQGEPLPPHLPLPPEDELIRLVKLAGVRHAQRLAYLLQDTVE